MKALPIFCATLLVGGAVGMVMPGGPLGIDEQAPDTAEIQTAEPALMAATNASGIVRVAGYRCEPIHCLANRIGGGGPIERRSVNER